MDNSEKPSEEIKAKPVDLFEVWKEYERVAMHFNELIIQLRVRALAGVAAISALFGFLLKGEAPGDFQWGILAAVLVMLILVWIAIWCLDIRYYNRLLVGAVRAILEIEKASKTENTVIEINMSHRIEETVAGDFSGLKDEPCLSGRRLFYGIVFISLVFGATFSSYQHYTGNSLAKSDKSEKPQASPITVPSTLPR